MTDTSRKVGSVGNVEPSEFRQVLGQYPTGVVVVTATTAGGEPTGMTVGSFTSVSLDPPLVAFMPAKNSSSWAELSSSDGFCVNILRSHQEEICRVVATRKSRKFEGVEWRSSALGNPIIAGCVAYVECTLDTVHDGGDHEIVVGRVRNLAVENPGVPLLFYRGGYGSFVPLSMAAGDADLVQQLRMVDLIRPRMENLATQLDTEVTAVSLVRGELVLTAAAGRARTAKFPTRVGQRMPFMPPLGGVFAAWGDDGTAQAWVSHADEGLADRAGYCGDILDRIRRRGVALGIGHDRSEMWEIASHRASQGDPSVTEAVLRERIAQVSFDYNPEDLDPSQSYEFRFGQAPVFATDGSVALALTVWGPPGRFRTADIEAWCGRLLETAAEAAKILAAVDDGSSVTSAD